MPTALDMARTVLGFSEGKDREALIDYMKTGGQNIDPATRAWCASFINASLNKAGYSGTGSDLARSFLQWGNAVEPGNVQPGDVGVYARGSDPKYGHAGIVESYDPKTGMVKMISGNAGATGAVEEGSYAASGALGFRRATQQLDAQMEAAGYTPEQRRNAIASIESAGSGDYAALGSWTGDPVQGRDRAYGRYQVMGSNIGPWAEQYLKKSGVTADQFLKDPALQDQLFDAVFGGYAGKYGERGAASMWFTGRPNEPNVTDVNGKLYGKTYADKYMAALGAPGGASPGGGATTASASPYALPPAGKDKKDSALAAMAKAGMSMGNQPWQMPQIEPTPGAARVDQPATPLIDPQQAEARRQQLASVLARLNQGSLV